LVFDRLHVEIWNWFRTIKNKGLTNQPINQPTIQPNNQPTIQPINQLTI
jgi:hypothetical protein